MVPTLKQFNTRNANPRGNFNLNSIRKMRAKKLDADKKMANFSLRISEFEKAHLNAMALMQNRPVSKIVMDALMQYDSGFNPKRVDPFELTNELHLLISLMNILENNPDPEPTITIREVIRFVIDMWEIDMEHSVTMAICNRYYKPKHPKQTKMEVVK